MGQVDNAIGEYKKTIGWLPTRSGILHKRVDQFLSWKAAHPSPAEEAYRRSVALAKSTIGPRPITPEVEQSAARAVALEPHNLVYLRNLLDIQIAMRENSGAMKTARQILALAPADGKTHALLAFLLIESAASENDFRTVEAEIRRSQSDPSVAATRCYVLGLLAIRRGQPAAAVRDLKESLRFDPGVEVTYFKLSQALNMAGLYADAAVAKEEYRRRHEAKRQLDYALTDIAQHPDRLDLYERAVRVFDHQGLHQQAQAIKAAEKRRIQVHHQSSASGSGQGAESGPASGSRRTVSS
jgi:tetratricopeptide (TPR) repeat protein